jgi:hypothetical protein
LVTIDLRSSTGYAEVEPQRAVVSQHSVDLGEDGDHVIDVFPGGRLEAKLPVLPDRTAAAHLAAETVRRRRVAVLALAGLLGPVATDDRVAACRIAALPGRRSVIA